MSGKQQQTELNVVARWLTAPFRVVVRIWRGEHSFFERYLVLHLFWLPLFYYFVTEAVDHWGDPEKAPFIFLVLSVVPIGYYIGMREIIQLQFGLYKTGVVALGHVTAKRWVSGVLGRDRYYLSYDVVYNGEVCFGKTRIVDFFLKRRGKVFDVGDEIRLIFYPGNPQEAEIYLPILDKRFLKKSIVTR